MEKVDASLLDKALKDVARSQRLTEEQQELVTKAAKQLAELDMNVLIEKKGPQFKFSAEARDCRSVIEMNIKDNATIVLLLSPGIENKLADFVSSKRPLAIRGLLREEAKKIVGGLESYLISEETQDPTRDPNQTSASTERGA